MMQGSIQPLIQLYDSNERVLAIPVYQRNYDWKQEHCARLFDDLLETHRENRSSHFFGSIFYASEGLGVLTIIDGQQRLTTVNLLFLALWRSIREETVDVEGDPQELAEEIYDTFLRSKYAKEGFSKLKLKLKPVKADQKAYESLFGDLEGLDESSNVTANFRYFMNRIAHKELSAEALFGAIRRLEIMRLELGRDDDAQLIFESLNSTGLDLSQADMIRNYVLMGQDRETQEELYESFWNPIELLVHYETSEFVRSYLTAQMGRVPRQSNVYDEFKMFHRGHELEIRDLLGDMLGFAQHQAELTTASTQVSPADRLLRRFNLLDRTVALPFLMLVMRDFRANKLTADQLVEVLRVVDTYLTRRWVCGYPTNSLNKIFAILHRETVKASREVGDFVDVLVHQLLQRTGSGAFPRDDEFSEALMTNDFYHVYGAQRNYFWESLENGDSNDTRDIANALARGDISIEHIMPQNPRPEWYEAMGEDANRIHETWLNRLGNLTVTGYNSSYSNRSFLEKRDHEDGFAASPYRVNTYLRSAESWGEPQMEERANRMRGRALGIWPMPVSEFQPEPEARDVQPMGEDANFTGRWIKSWEFQGVEHEARSWKQMLIDFVSLLAETHRAELFRHAENEGNGFHLTDDPSDYHTLVMPGLSVWTSSSTETKMWLLRLLFESLDLDKDELLFHLWPEQAEGNASGDV